MQLAVARVDDKLLSAPGVRPERRTFPSGPAVGPAAGLSGIRASGRTGSIWLVVPVRSGVADPSRCYAKQNSGNYRPTPPRS